MTHENHTPALTMVALLGALMVLLPGCADSQAQAWACVEAADVRQQDEAYAAIGGSEAFRTSAQIPLEATHVAVAWSYTHTGGVAVRFVGPNGTLLPGDGTHGAGTESGAQAFRGGAGTYTASLVAQAHAVISEAQLKIRYQTGDPGKSHC